MTALKDIPELASLGFEDAFQQGVIGTSFKVTPPATAGGKFTIKSGSIWLKDASGVLTRHVMAADDTTSVSNPAANSSGNPRVDRLYAVYANWGAAPVFHLEVGTPSAGATLPGTAGSQGAGAAPANSVCIWEGLMGAGASTYGATQGPANWLDRRPWAGGYKGSRFDSDTSEYNINNTVHWGNVTQRVEVSPGSTLWIVGRVGGVRSPQSGAPTFEAWPALTVDSASQWSGLILGTGEDGPGTTQYGSTDQRPSQSNNVSISGSYAAASGSRLFRLGVGSSAASGGAQYGWGPYQLDIMELPAGLSDNGTS